jgi:hypothetical protein
MPFNQEIVAQVWQHARVMTDFDPEGWRQDECGAWIRREHYGRGDSEYGWKIVNVSVGGPDTVENLRPLHHARRTPRARAASGSRAIAASSGAGARRRAIRRPR